MSTELTREQACDKFIAQKMRDGAGGLNRMISRSAFEAGWSARDANTSTERLARQAQAMAEQNTILRKVACFVPARLWMEAKEKAGFGTEIRSTGLSDPSRDEAWLRFCAAGPDVATLRAEVERLRAAIEAIQSAPIWGHGHWDHTMQRGAGCNLCIEQHKARQQLQAALAGEVTK